MSKTDKILSGEVPFSGSITFPKTNPVVATVNSPGGTINLTRITGTWTGFELAGQAVTQSTLVGMGIMLTADLWVARGYDVGTLANGDQYQGEWEETGSFSKGSSIVWRIKSGSGTLKGITGYGTITCVPDQSGNLICQAFGFYTLPPATDVE